MYNYHSALKGFEVLSIEPCFFFKSEFITAFQHSILAGLPPLVNECEFMYADLPWMQGNDIFYRRAGVTPDSWKDVITAFGKAAKEFGKPTFFIGGKQMQRYLPPCEVSEIDFSVHKSKALLFSINSKPGGLDYRSTDLLLSSLFSKYDKGADIACGYGFTALYALKQCKSVVLSDINSKCIGYINQNYKQWYENFNETKRS